MMRYSMILTAAVILVLGFAACKKSDNKNSARTVENLSGTYNLTALSIDLGSIDFNLYDTLPACQKDNVILLNANGTAQFVDAGVACEPPSDSADVWHLSPNNDSLYLGSNSTFIKTWDGKSLVLKSSGYSGYQGDVTITLVKH
jgi:hypothetical protein